jgi:Protein of unknown function, DUF547
MWRICALVITLSWGLPWAVAALDDGPPADPRPDAQAWARVLEKYAKDGGVDYAGLKKDRSDLDAYLASVAAASPASWSKAEKTAFWINAYNAQVLYYMIDRAPDVSSIQPGDEFFSKLTSEVAGQPRTLDEIETALRSQGDPRVLFALACPAASCPGLRPEPYRAEALDSQLASQTRDFLANPRKGLRYDPESNTLYLSPIFKQYAGDFTGGSSVLALFSFARSGLADWVVNHVPEELGKILREKEPEVKYLEFDGRVAR